MPSTQPLQRVAAVDCVVVAATQQRDRLGRAAVVLQVAKQSERAEIVPGAAHDRNRAAVAAAEQIAAVGIEGGAAIAEQSSVCGELA